MSESTATEVANGQDAGVETVKKRKGMGSFKEVKAAWEAAGSKYPGPDETRELLRKYLAAMSQLKLAKDQVESAEGSMKRATDAASAAARDIILATGAATIEINGVEHKPFLFGDRYMLTPPKPRAETKRRVVKL